MTTRDASGHNMEYALSLTGHRRVDQRSCNKRWSSRHNEEAAPDPVQPLTAASGSGRDGGAAEDRIAVVEHRRLAAGHPPGRPGERYPQVIAGDHGRRVRLAVRAQLH